MKLATIILIVISSLNLLNGQSIEVIRYSGFDLAYNKADSSTLWTRHYLTVEMVDGSGRFPRLSFHSSEGSRRASEYTRSGYDRGHLVPSADMTYDSCMNYYTFDMKNIVPQYPGINRRVWKELEMYFRLLPEYYGGTIAIETQCVYESGKRVNGIPVPDYFYKRAIDVRTLEVISEHKILNIPK